VPSDKKSKIDSKPIRSAAVTNGVTYITTLEGAQAALSGMDSLERIGFSVKTIQEYCHSGSIPQVNLRRDVEWRRKMWG
jgi:hypothetical protein